MRKDTVANVEAIMSELKQQLKVCRESEELTEKESAIITALRDDKSALVNSLKNTMATIKNKTAECGTIDIELRTISDKINALVSQIAEHDANIAKYAHKSRHP